MTKCKRERKLNSKKLVISCNHEIPPKRETYKNRSIQTRCSAVAYTGCTLCILKYLYTVYKKPQEYIERAKKFVTECVCFHGHDRPVINVYKTLKFCYSIGLSFGMEVFEFEDRFSRKQIFWLLKHDVPYYCLNINDLIGKEYWDIVCFIATKNEHMKEMPETIRCLLLPSSIVSIVLLFLHCENV